MIASEWKQKMENDNLTPCQSIKLYCKTRCFTTTQEVKTCDDPECPLFPYRLGKNPNRAKSGGSTRWSEKRQPGKIITANTVKKKTVEFDVKGKDKVRIIVEDIE